MPFKEYNQDQLCPFPPSLHEFFPEGHLPYVINEVLSELDLRELYDQYSDLGSSAYHPEMMLKLLFYGYAMGERSCRVIAHRLRSDVAYMYLSALQQPDFRAINRFLKDNVDLLKGSFVQIVKLFILSLHFDRSIVRSSCKLFLKLIGTSVQLAKSPITPINMLILPAEGKRDSGNLSFCISCWICFLVGTVRISKSINSANLSVQEDSCSMKVSSGLLIPIIVWIFLKLPLKKIFPRGGSIEHE